MILLITGMHRSGTSALASIIDELGIMPLLKNDMAADVINPAGYFESTKVCSVNDKVLGESLDTWDSAFTGIRQGLIESNSTIASRVLMIKTLVGESGISPQALPTKFSYIKDPRFCLTYPEWDRALNQVSPIVLSVRNPMTVSQSLWIRNGFTKIHSLALWWSYYRSALTATSQNRSLLMVGFENLCESPMEEITRISDWLSTNFKYHTPKSNLKIAHKKLNLAFIRATKHERGSSSIQYTAHEKEVLDFYHSLLNSDFQGIRGEFLGTAPSWVSEVLETYGSVSHSLSFARKSLLASQATNFEISKQLDELAKRNQNLEVWLRDTESARETAIAENFGLNEKLNSVAKQNQDLEVGRQNDLNEQLALTESINQLESETNLLAERLSTTLQRNSNLETRISETESARAIALAEVQLLTERTSQLESETNLLAERLSTTLQRNSNLETWISETESARVIANQQVEDLQLTCANLERNLQSSNQAFHDLAAHQATLLTSERALKAIVKSNSWRATEPLRKLGEIYRKLHQYFIGLRASRKNSNCALEVMNVLPLKPISEVRVAVVVHVYYPELLEELLNYLKEISESFCLILTGPRESRVLKMLDKNIRSNNWKFDQKSVQILLVENRGRDIGPFCSAINEFGLDSVPFILKLHTKASPHRTDGELWRRHLVSSLCSSKQRVTRIISALGSTTGPSMVIPDGQIGTHSEAGANFNQMKFLLSRVGINYSILELKELRFGMGSMFWCRGQTLEPIRRLALSSIEFDEEAGQLDGTLAHAIERILGVLATRSGSPLVTADEVKQIYPRVPTPTFYSFFLPQFHSDSNNDEWWGEGFNEWQLLDRTEPLFPGHQILTPANGTKYDLSNSQEVLNQLDKAKQMGLSGLLMYHYVFGSRNVLRRPFEVMLKQTELPLPIALAWANENWTRKWDGQDSEILVSQEYTESVINQLSDDFISLIKAGHALMTPLPTLVVYRPLAQLLELSLLDQIREKVWQAVNSEISIGGVCSSYSCADWPVIKQRGFDFAIEFPPHSSARPTSVSIALQPQIYDFNRLVSDSLDSTISDSKIWRGAMPGWDNSPRRGASSHLFTGSNPLDFRRWILGLAVTSSSPIVINALNEWGEGAVLEPTAQFGDSFQNVIGEFSLMNQKNSTC